MRRQWRDPWILLFPWRFWAERKPIPRCAPEPQPQPRPQPPQLKPLPLGAFFR